MAKVGRPPWIPSEEELEKVESLAARGLTQEQIADCIGIHLGTLSAKKSEFDELSEAIKRGKAKGIALVTAELLKNVKAKNVTAQIFYLKCQAKWKEAKDETLSDEASLMQKLIDKL